MTDEELYPKPNAKTRLETFVYGLLYPAFFGNMIYDFINLILDDRIIVENNVNPVFIADCSIILLVVFDYIHLFTDVNKIFNKPELKSPLYFICDILTPNVLFISFVLMKKNITILGLLLYCITPAIILGYKISNSKSMLYFIPFAFVSLLIFVYIAYNGISNSPKTIYLVFPFILLSYICYIFLYYPKFSRSVDIENVKALKTKLEIKE